MRIKLIIALLIALLIFIGNAAAGDLMITSGRGTGKSEFQAVKKAYKNMTSSVLRKIAGDQASIRGDVGKPFHEEVDKDALSFIQQYFQDEDKECRFENDSVFCSVQATAKLFEFRPAVKAALTDMNKGSQRIGKYRIAIIRNPNNSDISNLANAIHSELLKYGHKVDLKDKDERLTIVGQAGNLCDQYRKAMEERGPKSKAYSQYHELLKTCARNKDIARTIDIISSGVKTWDYDSRRRSEKGELTLNLEIRSGKTGRVDMNVGSKQIQDIGKGGCPAEAESNLRNRLVQRAAAIIVKSLNDSLAEEAKDLRREASAVTTLEKNTDHIYTIKINGLSDTIYADRSKAKLVRNVIKTQYASKPEKDHGYSESLTQVYRFGTQHPIDSEDLLDALYRAAHEAGYIGFRAEVDSDGVFILSFGG